VEECENTVQTSVPVDPRTQFVHKDLDEHTPGDHFDQCRIFIENTTEVPDTMLA
jgi:hypothetical protein